MNIEQLRKQAKELLAELRAGNSDAVTRLAENHPGPRGELALHDAQLVLARELGFPNWSELKHHLEFRAADRESRLDLLMQAAKSGGQDRFLRLLAEDPELRRDPATAAILGDLDTLQAWIEANRDALDAPTRFDNWTLLMIACASPLLASSGHRADVLAGIHALLAAGANPNARISPSSYPDAQLGALYAASGISRDTEVVRLLLAHGADADDNESLYHATEADNLEILSALIDAGADTSGNIVYHALDHEMSSVLALLLDRGADPNGPSGNIDMTPLQFAVHRGRSLKAFELLLDAGADPNRGGHSVPSLASFAALHGRHDVIQLLRQRGHVIDLTATEEQLLAGQRPDEAAMVELARLLSDAAQGGRTERVRELLNLGWPVNARGDNGGTAIHWACWYGNLAMVEAILPYGPDLTLKDTAYGAMPVGWADHGAEHSPSPKEDFPRILELLVRAGSPLPLEPVHCLEEMNDMIRRLKGEAAE